MASIDRPVSQARFRLNLNHVLEGLAVGVLSAAGAWGIVQVVDRAFSIGIPLSTSLGSAAAIVVVITAVVAFLRRQDALAAAVAIDRAAGLKERISSALSLSRNADPYAQAIVRDAESKAGGIHVATHIPLRAPALWPWSSATVIAAGLIFAFMPQLNLWAKSEKKTDPSETLRASAEAVAVKQVFNEEMSKVRKLVEDTPGLADLRDELKALEIPNDPGVKPEDVRRDVLKKLDKVADQLAEKRDSAQFRAIEEMKREFAKLETKQSKDATSKLSQALAQGNAEQARKALDEMKKELMEAAEKSDAESKQKLQEMAEKLEKLSKEMKSLADSQKMQKELENKAGLSEEDAKKLLEELAKMDPKQLEKELQKRLGDKSGMNAEQIKEMAKKLAQNQEAKKQMQEIAKKLAQAAQQCQGACQKQGNGESGSAEAQAAAGALQGASDQLSDMEMAEQMANELEAQLQDLKDAREGMCQGNGKGPGKKNDNIGNQGPNEGYGYGSRIGKEAAAHKYKAARAQVRTQSGEIIGQMLIEGPQIKGEASAEVKDAVNSAVRDATDAVEHDRVPRQYQEVTKKYFERLAQLNGPSPAKPATPEPAKEDAAEKSKDD